MIFNSNSEIRYILSGAALIAVVIFGWIMSRQSKKEEGSSAASSQVYVGNLSYRVKERHLKDYFSQFGTVKQLRIIKSQSTGRSKGYGFITFGAKNQASKATKAHGSVFEGRSLVVRIAKPRN